MAVFVEPPEYRLGLKLARGEGRTLHPLEHWVERTQPEGARSGPATSTSSPTTCASICGSRSRATRPCSCSLFVPPELTLVETDIGRELRGLELDAVARPSGPAVATSATCTASGSGCSGRAGRSGSTGPSSSRRTASTRSTRCTRSGSATRASSSWRRARVTLPMPEPERSRVMAVRLGERSFDEVLAEIDERARPPRGGARARRRSRTSPTGRQSTRSSSTPTAEPGAGGSRKAPPPSEAGARRRNPRMWRNRQTHRPQKPAGQPMGVRLPPSALIPIEKGEGDGQAQRQRGVAFEPMSKRRRGLPVREARQARPARRPRRREGTAREAR